MNAGRYRVRCQDCGPVEVAAADVRLAVSARPGRSFYAFRCPGCQRTSRREADQRMVDLLRAAGVLAVEVRA